jgi:hypothetical protein
MERESREVWAKRVERWKDSELSAKDFASEVGINEHSLKWWRWRLGAEAKGEFTPRRSPGRSKSRVTKKKTVTPESPPLTFVEVVSPMSSGALEIALPSTALFVRVRPGFDDATLSRVLDVLERRR